MNNIQIFQNEQFGKVRIAMNESDEPLFCAKDVANALGYIDTADAIQRHCKSGKKVYHPHENSAGGINMVYIPEKDVYRLIMRSNLPDAEKFQDWVCDEVLPSIRKYGAYMTNETLEKALTSPDFLIQLATNLKEEKQKRIEAEQKIQKDAPKVLLLTLFQLLNAHVWLPNWRRYCSKMGLISVRTACLLGCVKMVISVRKDSITINQRKKLWNWDCLS